MISNIQFIELGFCNKPGKMTTLYTTKNYNEFAASVV